MTSAAVMRNHPFNSGGTTTGVCLVCDGPVTEHDFAIIRLIHEPILLREELHVRGRGSALLP